MPLSVMDFLFGLINALNFGQISQLFGVLCANLVKVLNFSVHDRFRIIIAGLSLEFVWYFNVVC